jgi:hypothetical protein
VLNAFNDGARITNQRAFKLVIVVIIQQNSLAVYDCHTAALAKYQMPLLARIAKLGFHPPS